MKTGIELINEERREQIEIHGWSLEHDKQYVNKELVQAAEFCMLTAGMIDKNVFWPPSWDFRYARKILIKDKIGQLTVAGAFLMAENARRGDRFHDERINLIAAEIDRLQK